jgi:hypothetical protein
MGVFCSYIVHIKQYFSICNYKHKHYTNGNQYSLISQSLSDDEEYYIVFTGIYTNLDIPNNFYND